MKNYSVDFYSLPWEEPAPGVRFKALVRDHTRLRIIEFSKEFVETEWCVKSHIGYVLEGGMEIEFVDAIRKYKAGDGLFIPKGEENKHRHYSTITTTRLFLVEDA